MDADDPVGHLLRRHAAVVPDDADDRDVDDREDVLPHRVDRGAAQHQHEHRHHDERVGAAQRESNDPHESTTMGNGCAEPRVRPRLPSTATVTPHPDIEDRHGPAADEQAGARDRRQPGHRQGGGAPARARGRRCGHPRPGRPVASPRPPTSCHARRAAPSSASPPDTTRRHAGRPRRRRGDAGARRRHRHPRQRRRGARRLRSAADAGRDQRRVLPERDGRQGDGLPALRPRGRAAHEEGGLGPHRQHQRPGGAPDRQHRRQHAQRRGRGHDEEPGRRARPCRHPCHRRAPRADAHRAHCRSRADAGKGPGRRAGGDFPADGPTATRSTIS